MARRYNLGLSLEYERAIANYNAKIRRLSKTNEFLPEKINLNEALRNVESTKDLRTKIANLKRFTKRGSEELITTQGGITMTKYELESLKRDTKAIKQRLTREINKLESIVPTSLGVKQEFSLKTLPSDRLVNLKARRKSLNKNINKLSGDQFQYFINKINTNRRPSKYRDTTYQDNYINKMLLYLGYQVGYDSEKLEEIRTKLSKLNTNDFLKLMDTEKIVQVLQNFYNEGNRRNKSTIEDIYDKYDMLYENIDKIIASYK